LDCPLCAISEHNDPRNHPFELLPRIDQACVYNTTCLRTAPNGKCLLRRFLRNSLEVGEDNKRADPMIKFRIRLPVVLSLAILSIAFVISWGFFNEATAKCSTDKCLGGYASCLGWCSAHNKTPKSDGACSVKCGDYWHDGASIGRDPTNPSGPPRKVDPGKLKNPPTTVSNPNTPTQSPPQIRERQHKER
jgi:hypothetical protein